LTKKYERAVTRAFLAFRNEFSSERALADPALNAAFIKACRDFGVDDNVFHLNLALIGLRKHNKLKAKSRRSVVPDQGRYAVASEIAARVMFYRRGASVDTTLAHPELVQEFDRLASSITPGFSSFEYRWAALNMRKKGASERVRREKLHELHWSKNIRFDAPPQLPQDQGIYALREDKTWLFVAGTENIRESVSGQQRIAEVQLFEPEVWRPDPRRLFWQYVRTPELGSVE